MKPTLVAALCCLACLTASPANQPNIIFIMADDLGNADVGYHGGQVKTPNLDKLAAEGVRLESFYGMPVCTPSRASLMTGRYAMRYGLQTLVIFPSHTYGLPTDERTLPQALKDAGYQTYMVGKWHLGHADKKYWPQNRGFDYFYGNVVGEVDYFTRERGGVIDWQRNGKFLKEPGYYTTLIGDDAVKLINQQDPSKPFFLRHDPRHSRPSRPARAHPRRAAPDRAADRREGRRDRPAPRASGRDRGRCVGGGVDADGGGDRGEGCVVEGGAEMTDAQKIEKVRRALTKIAVHALDGQIGADEYALDRLRLIRETAEAVLKSTGDDA